MIVILFLYYDVFLVVKGFFKDQIRPINKDPQRDANKHARFPWLC
jgi:hypothetical protein